MLYNLGMEPTNEDVDALLMELGATPDGIVTFVEFTGVLARLKVWELDDFLSSSALDRDLTLYKTRI